jgi:hypothetical protein
MKIIYYAIISIMFNIISKKKLLLFSLYMGTGECSMDIEFDEESYSYEKQIPLLHPIGRTKDAKFYDKNNVEVTYKSILGSSKLLEEESLQKEKEEILSLQKEKNKSFSEQEEGESEEYILEKHFCNIKKRLKNKQEREQNKAGEKPLQANIQLKFNKYNGMLQEAQNLLQYMGKEELTRIENMLLVAEYREKIKLLLDDSQEDSVSILKISDSNLIFILMQNLFQLICSLKIFIKEARKVDLLTSKYKINVFFARLEKRKNKLIAQYIEQKGMYEHITKNENFKEIINGIYTQSSYKENEFFYEKKNDKLKIISEFKRQYMKVNLEYMKNDVCIELRSTQVQLNYILKDLIIIETKRKNIENNNKFLEALKIMFNYKSQDITEESETIESYIKSCKNSEEKKMIEALGGLVLYYYKINNLSNELDARIKHSDISESRYVYMTYSLDMAKKKVSKEHFVGPSNLLEAFEEFKEKNKD